ncbi:MAG: tetratricopeptide repeat protein [Spirochaetales bacterium]|nr:tetratricopeptide repeat protein [Spirochaetales bacterium]
MTMKDRFKLLRTDPGAYYRENIDRITISPDGDIEEMLALLLAGLSVYNGDFFVKLSNIILNHRDFSDSPEYQYYYHLSRFSFFRHIEEMNYALESIQKAYNLSLILEDSGYIVKSLGQLSALYSNMHDYETAFFYLEEALKYADRIDDRVLFADTYNSLGLLMFNQKRYEEALKAFERALDLYDLEKEKEKHLNYVILLLNTGETLMEIGEEIEAESFFSSGIRIAEERDFIDYFGQLILLIAEVFHRRKQYDKSYSYMKRFISQSDRFREEQSRVHKIHDTDKLKEEVMTLNTLKQRNDELSSRLNSLYNRLESRNLAELKAGALFREISDAMNKGELQCWFQP